MSYLILPTLILISVLLQIAFGQGAQGKEGAQCPCNFNFSKAVQNAAKIPNENEMEASPIDIGCYGAVPLIAGIKNIETDEELKEKLRNNSFTMSMVVEYTCFHYGAYPAVFTKEDMEKDGTAPSLVTELLTSYPDFNYSLFFYNNVVAGQKEITTTLESTAISNYSCGFFYNLTQAGAPLWANGTCEDLTTRNRKVDRALCMAIPIEIDDNEKNEIVQQCRCPCTFWQDDAFRCTRDVIRCLSVNNTDDMIATCAMVGAAPASVARVPDNTSVPEEWISDALFFIGDSNNNFTIDDNVKCGYRGELTDDNDDVVTDKAGNPIYTTYWSENETCQTFLEQLLAEEMEMFAVLCTTTMINATADSCDTDNEGDMMNTDPPDCGVKGVFDPMLQAPLMMVGLMVVGIIWNGQREVRGID